MKKLDNGVEFEYYGHTIKIIAEMAGDEGAIRATDNGKLIKDFSWGTNHYENTAREFLQEGFIKIYVNPYLAKIKKEADEMGTPYDEEAERAIRIFELHHIIRAFTTNPRLVDGELVL